MGTLLLFHEKTDRERENKTSRTGAWRGGSLLYICAQQGCRDSPLLAELNAWNGRNNSSVLLLYVCQTHIRHIIYTCHVVPRCVCEIFVLLKGRGGVRRIRDDGVGRINVSRTHKYCFS